MTKATPQSTLFDAPRPGSNMPEFTVSDISKLLKKTVEETFGLVRIRGEISECKFHSSGHVYLTLKDEGAILASVCWRGQVSKLDIKPEVGMDVVCTGRLTTYSGQSKYQMVIEGMALAGMGALLKMLEERKKKLAAEGLFDKSRKRALPFLPNVIGVITSPSGAVIRDILHRLADRFPRHVLVWPVAVQGEGAAEQVAAAIQQFNALAADGDVPCPDVLIVARGGGSVEDLMPFNEEIVVRAVAASHIPVISAVGHETDTTLIDYAADIRAPTPTAAAELAVPVRENLLTEVLSDGMRLEQAIRRAISERRERIMLVTRSLGDPSRAIEPLLQRLDDKTERLAMAWKGFFQRRQSRVTEYVARIRHPRDVIRLAAQRLQLISHRADVGWREIYTRKQNRLEKFASAITHLSPRAVLGRGYTLIQNEAGQVIISRDQVKRSDYLRVEFFDGSRTVVVEE